MFGNTAMIQEKHIIAQISDGSQVMGNENISESQLFLQITERSMIWTWVWASREEIASSKKNDLWLACHSPGNADTLQLSAGQFMGISVCIGGIKPTSSKKAVGFFQPVQPDFLISFSCSQTFSNDLLLPESGDWQRWYNPGKQHLAFLKVFPPFLDA